MPTDRCRHNRLWIVCGGWLAWCYECGAIRDLQKIPGVNGSRPCSGWTKPVGKDGKNPYDKHEKSCEKYRRQA